MKRVPIFAVVGRVNEGKSSIVAALTEGEDVVIGPEPGTTRTAKSHPLIVGGTTLVEIVDTPGFQQPEAVFAWLTARAGSAADRPGAVRAFLAEFSGKPDFVDECELLRPVMDGATIIYVVDASHPFRRSYEDEMQILRWTGRPCIALLNQTSSESHVGVWKEALKQFFDHVRYFDAHKNLFEDRIALLSLLSHLVDEDSDMVNAAIAALHQRDEKRLERSANTIAHMLADLVSFTVREQHDADALNDERRQAMAARFAAELRRIEVNGRAAVESQYAYRKLERREDKFAAPIFEQDLFAGEVWQLLGLSRAKLIVASTAAMALAGGVIDAAVLGHTFLAGTLIGAGIGFAGGAYAAYKKPQKQFFGLAVAGSMLIVGPHRDPQFPWIVLDRALLHHHAVSRRPHSLRTPLHLTGVDHKRGVADKLDKLTAGKLLVAFNKLRSRPSEHHTLTLKNLILGILRSHQFVD